MDRAEARKRLEANRGAFVFKETNEALDLAIEALQEPKAKGVDFNKEWLIEEIARRDTTDGTVKVFSGREVNEIILNAPSVTPTVTTGEWKKAVIEKLESLMKDMENEIEDAKKHPENYTKNFIRGMEQQVAGVAHAAHEIIDMPSATDL